MTEKENQRQAERDRVRETEKERERKRKDGELHKSKCREERGGGQMDKRGGEIKRWERETHTREGEGERDTQVKEKKRDKTGEIEGKEGAREMRARESRGRVEERV